MGYAKGWKLVRAEVRSASETDEKVRYGAPLSTCGSVVCSFKRNNRRRGFPHHEFYYVFVFYIFIFLSVLLFILRFFNFKALFGFCERFPLFFQFHSSDLFFLIFPTVLVNLTIFFLFSSTILIFRKTLIRIVSTYEPRPRVISKTIYPALFVISINLDLTWSLFCKYHITLHSRHFFFHNCTIKLRVISIFHTIVPSKPILRYENPHP